MRKEFQKKLTAAYKAQKLEVDPQFSHVLGKRKRGLGFDYRGTKKQQLGCEKRDPVNKEKKSKKKKYTKPRNMVKRWREKKKGGVAVSREKTAWKEGCGNRTRSP